MFIFNLLTSPLEPYKFQINTINSLDKTLGLSIAEIGKNYYLKNQTHINIVKSIKSENLDAFFDVIDTLISTFKIENIAFQIENAKLLNATDTKRTSNMLFIDSVESFNIFLKILNSAYFKVGKVITIISIKELTISDMKIIFDLLFKQYFVGVNILTTDSNKTVNLYTFFPFEDFLNCSNTNPIKISTFDASSGKWSNSNNFYNRKTNDLMRCSIRIGTAATSSEPGILFRKYANGEIKIYGVEKEIFDIFAIKLNFTADYIPYFNGVGSIYPNGTGFGVLGNILNNDVDIGIGFVSLQYIRTLFLSVSHYYRIDALMLVGKFHLK